MVPSSGLLSIWNVAPIFWARFPHYTNTQVSGWNGFRIKTASIVGNLQHNLFQITDEPDVDLTRFGMFGDIV